MNEMDLTDIYRVFHPMTADYTFFSAGYGIFSKIDNIIGHKVPFNKIQQNGHDPLHPHRP
jgi:hypothetical protein